MRLEIVPQAPPTIAASLPLPSNLGGATVLGNDVLAPLYYTSFGQVAFQMPYGVATGQALVQVLRDGVWSNTVTANVVATVPEIAAITDSAYNVRDATHPAKAGEGFRSVRSDSQLCGSKWRLGRAVMKE